MIRARHLLGAALAALLATGLAIPARAQDDSRFDPARLKTPPLAKVKVQKPARYVLPNGIVVFLLENHELPVVKAEAYFKSSPTWIPDAKVGLGTITGEAMRSGGSTKHAGDWLDDRLAAIGASIDASLGSDQGSAEFRCLSNNLAEVMGYYAEVLREPAYPDDKIELSKVGLRRAIAERNDEMIPLLFRLARESVYGKGNPYSRKPEYATVEAVTRADCRALHDRVFQPNRMILALYGDFRSAEVKKLLAARFGDWKRGAGEKVTPVPLPRPTANKLVFAPKDDVTQTGVVMTQIGSRADDPDYASMQVLEMALGGGFQSRLVNKIRTERGLAYAAGAGAGTDYARPGAFVTYTLTRNDSAMTALGLLRDETVRVTKEPFTAQELETAKQSVVNGFVFNFEDPSSVLFRSAFFEMVGYPLDFLDKYQRDLDAVTAQSVLAAAQHKIRPAELVTVVVGKEKEFDKPLDQMGLPVDRVDITIPPPASKLGVGEATPEALAQGQAWLKKAAELAGGSAAWAAVTTLTMEEEGTLQMGGQSIGLSTTIHWQLPDKVLAIRKLPMGEIKQGFDGNAGWVGVMGKTQDEPKAAQELKQQYERSLFHLFAKPEAFQVQALEPRTVDGVSYNVAHVKSDVIQDWLLYFAPDGRLARMDWMGEGQQGGPAKNTEVYADWQADGSIQYPHTGKVLMDDKPFMDSKVTSVKLNPTLDAAMFKKPSD